MWLLTEPEMAAAGRALAAVMRPGDVIALAGPLGAGKTTLVRGLLAALGHEGDVPSPTFAIVQPYEALRLPVHHADLYRIEDTAELEEIGLDDVLFDGALVVEWPEHAGPGAWPQALHLSLEVMPDGRRALTWGLPETWEGRWPPPLPAS
ncbi:tRNA (adenosine(37)-N6)-threonylcarbamoyltransferase complex ATPase subunit type 1 TsaE [Sphingomonas rosea]|uniref:tRNA threonylcarbamoyladenosine biosynthesis protein TsaE n=1 Tax=Sphingomonas rosea TaxID=335605 RepID=A0ABP7UA04_9SPHN